LPQLAWDVFQRENIQTMDQLRAIAGQVERFDGIGPITVRVIRQELDRTGSEAGLRLLGVEGSHTAFGTGTIGESLQCLVDKCRLRNLLRSTADRVPASSLCRRPICLAAVA